MGIFSLLPPHLFAESTPEQRHATALDLVTLPSQQYLQHRPVCAKKVVPFEAIAISVQDKNSFLRIFLNTPKTT